MSTLQTVLNQRYLRRMADGRSFERGEEYFYGGRVHGLVENAGTLAANVKGTEVYRVKLWAENDELGFSCTCPVGAEREFCKHAVAVGLAWLEKDNPGGAQAESSAKSVETMDDVRTYLAAQEKSSLVDILMEHALDDERLRRKLSMKAAKNIPTGIDLAPYRQAINQVVAAERYIDYRSAYDYTHGIEEVINSIEELVTEGHATEGVQIAEYALDAVEAGIESVDDSDGNMGALLERIQEIHHAACQKAKPDPEALAKRLFEKELNTEYDVLYGAAETYADVLGEKGLAVYRKLSEKQWVHVRSLEPGQDDPEKYGKRFRLTHIMETLARQSGDVEALVAVKSRDLSSAYNFLQIAEAYRQAGKQASAMEWAERGVKAFPQRTDSRLREFLADEYHRRKRHSEAMELIWTEFADSPQLERYKLLKNHADRTGDWPAWREKALALLRAEADKAKKEARKDRWSWSSRADYSELVMVFLCEKDIEAAWHHAQEGGCNEELWLELAARREKDHPEEALPIYQRQIEPTLGHKNNSAYEEAVQFLHKIEKIMIRLGQKQEFTQYLNSIRTTHKIKRNFMKLLDQTKWA